MGFSLVPGGVRKSVFDVEWNRLAEQGVKLVLADLDNTLAAYSERKPSEQLKNWKKELESLGLTLFVLSNSRKSRRCPDFCEALDVPFLRHARKPSVNGFLKVMADYGVTPNQTVMVGDQIFTDILGANRAGVRVFLIEPVSLDNPFRKLRYTIETPFRIAGKRRESINER